MNLTKQITRLRGLNKKRHRPEPIQFKVTGDGLNRYAQLSTKEELIKPPSTDEFKAQWQAAVDFYLSVPEMLSIIETQHALLVMAKEALEKAVEYVRSDAEATQIKDGYKYGERGLFSAEVREPHWKSHIAKLFLDKINTAVTALTQAGL